MKNIPDRHITDIMDRGMKYTSFVVVRMRDGKPEYLDSTDPDVWIRDKRQAMASEDKRWILGHAERRGAFIEARNVRDRSS